MKSEPIPPPTRREIFAWCGFDFANSSFTTVMISVLYSVYFCNFICKKGTDGEAWWGLAMSMGQWIVVGISPFLGAWADWRASKKMVLFVTYLVCVVATFSLGFVYPGQRTEAVILVIIALVAFSLGENFCASFLPELATPESMGRVSGYGWSFGYLGGIASLLLCLLLLQQFYPNDPEGGLRASAKLTAIFFLVTGLPTFIFLKERAIPRGFAGIREAGSLWWSGFLKACKNRLLTVFFSAFFCYSAGMATVIVFASVFAEREFGFTMSELIVFFIFIQVWSAVGSLVCGFIQDRWGGKRCLEGAVALWIGVAFSAATVHSRPMFYLVGVMAGLAIGSTQSMSRAVVGQLVPEGRQGEYFGYWGTIGKMAAGFGPFIYGLVSSGSGSPRMALASMGVFFLGGGLLLRIMRGIEGEKSN